jgi:hypothetical protein
MDVQETAGLQRTRPLLVLLVLVSLAFNWYYLTGGFLGEDFIFLNMLRQEPLPYSRILGFWSTADYPALTSIWWFEGQGTTPFWRPLPSLVIEGSVRVFGERAFPLHLLSILVHGLVAATLFVLVRLVTGRILLALSTGLFFLSCEDHTMGVGWIATVTDLLSLLFVNLSLIAHVLWLQKRKPWALAASLLALVPALLSKESAVVAPLAIGLLTLVIPLGRDRELPGLSRSSVRAMGRHFSRDWISWLPALGLLAVYLGLYKLLGFGGFTSGLYVDPLVDPVRYLEHLVVHLPVMWLATLSPVPPSLTMFFPSTIPFLAVAGVVVFVLWIGGLWSMRKSALVAWALGFYILALLPQMATDASERGLYFSGVGGSILLALLLLQIGPNARRISSPCPYRFTRFVGWAVLVCVLIPGVLLSATMPFMYVPSFARPNEEAASITPLIEEKKPNYLIVLNTSGPMHTFYLHPIVQFEAGSSRDAGGLDVRVLSSMNGIVSVERIDERSFVLRTDRKGWLTNFFARVLRSPRPPKPGRVFKRDILTATFLEMTRDGRDVLAVRFDMNRPLDDPQILFIQWDGETFSPIDLAGLRVADIAVLADTSDVWASMW